MKHAYIRQFGVSNHPASILEFHRDVRGMVGNEYVWHIEVCPEYGHVTMTVVALCSKHPGTPWCRMQEPASIVPK